MPVRLNSSGGGSVTLDVPATAGTFTVNLPAANGDVVVTGGSSTVQFGAGSVSAPSITFSGDTNTGIYSPAADTIAFTEGGVEAMRLDASGNVGIGTTAPTARLDVNGSIVAGTANGVSMFVPVNSAIRDTASTGSTMFFDVATGGATHGAFNFRSSNSFTSRMVVASNGDLQFNSGYGSVATAYGCRAWVNFNGTGTVAIRASGNVSSITDNGVGQYTVNTTTVLPSDYCAVASAGLNASQTNAMAPYVIPFGFQAIGVILANNLSNGTDDSAFVFCVVFR